MEERLGFLHLLEQNDRGSYDSRVVMVVVLVVVVVMVAAARLLFLERDETKDC